MPRLNRASERRRLERLLVVSHVVHYHWNGRLHAYGPYAREMDIWAELFPTVVIAAPCRREPPPGDALAFTRANFEVARQIEAGGDRWTAKLLQLLLLPVLIWSLARAMRRVDAIHVRCPGNLGLLGVCLAPLFSRYLVAKYAGQWPDFPDASLAVRLQKAILRSRWWRGPVTVYGRWPGEPPQIVPFFTSILTRPQIERARRACRNRTFDEPVLRVLYVGLLGRWKNVDTVIRAVAELRARGLAIACDLVGSGPAQTELERLAASSGVKDCVHFVGGVEHERVLDFYERAHALVLVSNSEGWPKALAEGMAFGLVCIGSDRGLVPEMLGEGRGIVVPPRDHGALADALERIARSPDRLKDLRERSAAWGQRYSVDDLRRSLGSLMTTWWGVPLDAEPAAAGAIEATC